MELSLFYCVSVKWKTRSVLFSFLKPCLSLCSLQLFSLLDDADLGPMAADGFSLLMSDSTDVLNRACHADVRIMYRQRFFSENSAKLVQGFNAAPQGRGTRTDTLNKTNIIGDRSPLIFRNKKN